MNDILNVFYNEVAKDASFGRVDCNMMYNVLFKTVVEGKMLYKIDEEMSKNNSLFIPTLFINNKSLFDETLMEYYERAKVFYKDKIDKEDDFNKTILTLLWNNATEDDFKNPIPYIKRYTAFLDKPNFLELNNYQSIGYSSVLDSDVEVCLKEEPIYEETPYALYMRCTNNNLYYNYPVIRFGIYENKAYIYAIQQMKEKNIINEEVYNYQKKIHRKLFKVNENFDKEDNIDNVEYPENLTGISPSALVVLTYLLSLLEKENISDIIVPNFLPVRYNAKEISYIYKIELLKKKGYEVEKLNNELHILTNKHEEIQRNLSDKLLRSYRRLEHVFDNINITSLPYELDNNIHIKLNEYTKGNNKLLNEIYELNSFDKKLR
ncbi:MAG: hypothetical protein IJ574_02285 [Bacilli bacterium]|nr:hypothetical protein [Bacilli bacterium]